MEQDQTYVFKRIGFLNQSGQAAVEYILLLIITVSLVMGAKKVFGSLNDFMNAYIGDYVVCLMEYGELPSLGVSDSNQKNHSAGSGKSCDQQFAGFTLENGRPPVGGGSGSSAGGNPNSAGSNKNSSSSADKKGGDKSDSGNKDSDGKNNTNFARGSAKRSSPYANGQINRSNNGYGTADGEADLGSKKVKIIDDDELAGRKKKEPYGYSSRRSSGNGQQKYKAITGAMADEILKNSPKPRVPATTVKSLTGDTENRFRPYTKIFTPPEPKEIAMKEDDNSGFSFGNIIRWLIIGAMILAVIVFFGGQIMNYSNSKE